MSKIEVNAIEPQCGTTLTLGANNDKIVLGTGASFGGGVAAINWETTAQAGDFGALSGRGYFVNTTSAPRTVTLPATPSAGDIVAIADYAGTAGTNNITIAANGSEKIQGSTTDHVISTNGVTVTLVYVDSTQGWKLVNTGEASSLPEQALFTVATGGTITCCGDYKIHTFTGPGTFCVSQIGNGPTNPNGGPTTVSYMVVAGGGGQTGPGHYNGGGGAGGFREGRDIAPSYTASPLVAPAGLTITASPFPISVGAGGGANGSNSIFSTITSTGGGGGGSPGQGQGNSGGSGGGGSPFGPAADQPGGAGNTPSVSPPQGNSGGTGRVSSPPGTAAAGGGGGATAAGGDSNTSNPITAGNGGAGATTSISASPTAYAGGGGGAAYLSGAGGSGGTGGGGNGGQYPNNPASTNGTANTGGGAGGDAGFTSPTGGSGIVIIRYKYR